MRRNLTINRLVTLAVLLPALALGATACGDDDAGACDDVANPCDILDTTSCQNNIVQTCSENADGCLEWTETEVCGNNTTCSGGECLCNDECALGESQCDGDIIEVCAEDAEGCLYWSFDTDCSTSGQSCDDTADAVCVTSAGCGNDTIEGTELCDGADLGGQTCVDEGFGGGTLACNNTCDAYVTTGCTAAQTCGNDSTEGTELCDGADLNSTDCTDHGFYGGTLDCATDCSDYDTTGCVGTCGDDTINGSEVCDGADLANETCIDQGFYGGTLDCATDCSGYDTTGCIGTCGDDSINGGEVCDGTDFGTATCADYGYYTGTLACNSTCDTIDPAGCSESCGDNTINGTEVCDGADLGTATCVTEGFASGTLGCATGCTAFDTSGCAAPGELCANPYDVSSVTLPVQLTGTFTDDPATGFSCESAPANTVWYEYTPTATGNYFFWATNDTADNAWGRLAVFDGTACGPYDTELRCVASSSSPNVGGWALLMAGSTYLIAFSTDDDIYSMVDPQLNITFDAPNPGDLCTAPIDVTSATFPYTEPGFFNIDIMDGFSCDSDPTSIVWFQYTAPATGTFDIGVTNAHTNSSQSRLVVLDGTGCSPYDAELACVTDSSKSAMATVSMTSGNTYLIAFFTQGGGYGMMDPTIIISPSYTIGWCNLQYPQTLTAGEGTTQSGYGQLWIAGLTDQTNGPDTVPAVIGEMGVGPDGSAPSSDPSLWTWFFTGANMGFVHSSNDEYVGNFVVPGGGGSPYDMAFRFSGNGGITWTYCDTVDNSYDVSEAGALTVIPMPAPGQVIITEVMQNPTTVGDGSGEWFELYNTTGTDLNIEACELSDLGSDSFTIDLPLIVPAGGYVTLANSAAPGFTPNYAYNGFLLSNADDEIYLTCGGLVVDHVDWDGGTLWPDPTGASMSLDPASYDSTANDDGANWCEGSTWYNGDFGTPGALNPACP